MNIELVFTAIEANENLVKNKNVVIIDVLRATSVITTALANGAEYVIACKTVEEAFVYAKNSHSRVILGGERHALKIDGFDCGNSPYEYSSELVLNKGIILTTTNGTLAIENAKNAANLYIACILNLDAVAQKIFQQNTDTLLVCAGNNGKLSMEDVLCAGMIIDQLSEKTELCLDDSAYLVSRFCRTNIKTETDLFEIVCKSKHFSVLLGHGYKKDVEYCLKKNFYNTIPVYQNGKITNNCY